MSVATTAILWAVPARTDPVGTIGVMRYREVIRPPWWVYAGVVGMVALFCFTFMAVIGGPAAAVLFVILRVLTAWVIERRSLVLTVDEDRFHVRSVAIERGDILDVVALDAKGLRTVAGPDADGRATMVLRNLATKSGVKVDVSSDHPPYWLVSSKHPRELASALSSSAG